MSKLYLPIPIPKFIENFILYFLLRYRKKHYGLAFRLIKLTQGKFAKVDPEDYQKLSQYDWQVFENKSGNLYAIRLENLKYIKMHRVIMNAPKGIIVDHKNHDGLDNTKRNLRFATRAQNNYNTRSKKENSKYRGVYLVKDSGKFRAIIHYNRIRKHLGYFDNEEDAARAYDEAAKIYHGEFAILNFPPTESIQLHVGGS